METRASEIANYRGDAATALGSTVGAGVSPIYGKTDADRINTRLDAITVANMQKNKDLYELKLKQRDELFSKIGAGELKVDQALPQDRDLVRTKYLAPMRQMLLDNPDLRSDPDQYVKFQALGSDFEEAKTYAQHRYTLMTAMDTEIAKETDPEKKQRMIDHRNKSASQGLFEEVKPYQQTLDWDNETFATSAAVTSKTQDMVGDKIVTVTHSRTPLKEFVANNLHNYTDSPNKSLKNKMDVYGQSFQALPDEIKAQKLMEWNRTIKQANADEGYVLGVNPEYVNPIAFQMVKDPDTGKEHLVVPETAERIVLAQSILQGYKKTDTTEGLVSEMPSKIRGNDAQTAHFWARTKIEIPTDAKLKLAQAAKANADALKTRQEVTKANKDATKEQREGDYYINQTRAMFDAKRFTGLSTVKDFAADKSLAGYSPEARVVQYTDAATGEIHSSLSSLEQRVLGTRINSSAGLAVVIPDQIIFDDSDPRDPKYITIYDKDPTAVAPEVADEAGTAISGKVAAAAPKLSAAQQAYEKLGWFDKLTTAKPAADKVSAAPPQKVVKIVRANIVMPNMIKDNLGETTTGAESKVVETVARRYRELTGKENINATITGLTKTADWDLDAPAPAAAAAPPASATKLAPAEETKYQGWLKTNQQTETPDYDYRGYYQKNKGKDIPDGHMPDTYKLPSHITFSTDSKYSKGATKGGVWAKQKDGKWSYKPSEYVLSQHSADELKEYFAREEPDAELILPEKVPAPKDVKTKFEDVFKSAK